MELELMAKFFESRIKDYEVHMLTAIEGADSFYHFTAQQLPLERNVQILDLGCGTGLELDYYFKINQHANITGIDLSQQMLDILKKKYPQSNLELICGSYFDTPLGTSVFDAAVSVESLHHFTMNEKIQLYIKLFMSLKPHGYFILTDYFAHTEEDEAFFRAELNRLKTEQGITNNDLYHYDTPLTVDHETDALLSAGFNKVELLSNWGATYTIKAIKY